MECIKARVVGHRVYGFQVVTETSAFASLSVIRKVDDREGSGWVGVGGVVKPLDHLSQSFRVGEEVVFGLTTDKVHLFLVALSAYFTLRKSLKYASCR